MRALIYARYSTDRQKETSCDDQARLCRARAEAEGWTVEAVHADDGLSGSTPVASRPAGARLLADLLAGRAEILLLESLDRLSRDQVEAETLIRRIEHRGVRILGLCDGYDSASAPAARKLQRGLRGLINEIYIDDLRAKTHRGLAGQVERGLHAGGLAYGYRSIPATGGTRLEVHPEQAAIVREVFARYAAGESVQRIVSDLNARRVPSPRGSSWAVGALYGSPSKGTGILNNETYLGRVIWNRSQWVKNPDTGRRQRIERPRAEWQVIERPDLAIVDAAAWAAVRRRMDTPRLAGGSKGKGARASTLFGGLMTCGLCGGAVVAVNARLYGCSARKDRGPSVCRGLHVPRAIADARLLGIVREELLSPKAIARLHRQVKALQAEDLRQAAAREQAARARLKVLEGEIARLVDAVAEMGLSPALKARLQAAEVEQAARAAEAGRLTEPLPIPNAMASYRRLLVDFRNALSDDVPKARRLLGLYFGEIGLNEIDGEIFADLKEEPAALLVECGGLSLGMVAGARFSTRRRIFIYRKH